MEQFRTKIKRILPFLLALVVLISCIPPIQASAASSLTLSGVWRIGSGWAADVDHGDIQDFSISVDAYVYVNGVQRSITQLFMSEQDPQSFGGGTSASSDRYWDTSGDHYADDGLIYFNKPVTITNSHAIAFFTTYAWECEPNILSIDAHEEHRHYSIWTSQCAIDASGATFDCNLCSWSFAWTPSASKGTFLGFSDPDGGFYSGQVVMEFDGSLYLSSTYSSPVTPDPEPDPDPGTTYSSTITIDGVKYTFTSTTEQPAVSFQVTSGGVIMSYGDQSQYSLSVGSKTFLGLGYISGGAASFIPGETYELAAGDHTLYMIYADAGSEFILQAGQWQVGYNSSTGAYFPLSSWPEGLGSVPLDFTSMGSGFNALSYDAAAQSLCYGSTSVYLFDSSYWVVDVAAIVYFPVDQEVPEAFYKWFTANFTRTGDSTVYPVYSATINIYDNAGKTLLQSFSFTDVSSLEVSLDMTGQICVFRGNSLSSTWSPNSSLFSGFALAAGSAYPVFASGFSYKLPIDAFADVPVTLNLYVTSGSMPSDDVSEDVQTILSGFIATFVAPVMLFFSVEFIPGFSFGKLCLFAFCFGLLFWFLKIVR